VIDLHAHILPGLDDGPGDLDASVALARAAVASGTRTLAATSHVDHHFHLAPEALTQARAAVVQRLAAEGVPLEVVQGGEVTAERAVELDDDRLRALTLGGTDWLLLECPLSPAAASIEPVAVHLQRRGFRILLGHPERSPGLLRGGALERMTREGALSQVTSSSFAGAFGAPVRRIAFAMLEAGLVHVLATDAHDHAQRPPDLGLGRPALERRYGDVGEWLEWATTGVPAAVLRGEDPPPGPPPAPSPRPRGLRRLLTGS
jgi:protein-tyrosine phosphatase